ncbi:MAG: hypothetical protein SFU86_08940 [Pirellulaceae bacterium]|nr:hypothetical protein [Pirellulaceae bacterium]
MSTAVRQLVSTFEALPADERHEAVVEILRRAADDVGDLPDESLVAAADELFCNLDADEAGNVPS